MINKFVTFKINNYIKHTGRCVSYTCDDFGRIQYLHVRVYGLIFNVYKEQIIEIKDNLWLRFAEIVLIKHLKEVSMEYLMLKVK